MKKKKGCLDINSNTTLPLHLGLHRPTVKISKSQDHLLLTRNRMLAVPFTNTKIEVRGSVRKPIQSSDQILI